MNWKRDNEWVRKRDTWNERERERGRGRKRGRLGEREIRREGVEERVREVEREDVLFERRCV